MFSPLHTALCFYEPVPEMNSDETLIRAAWHHNWASRGWSTVELSSRHADAHPLTPAIRNMAQTQIPTVISRNFETANWVRYAALAAWFDANPTESHAVFVDYDIFNRKLIAADLLDLARSFGITLLTAQNPEGFGAFLLNRHAASVLPTLILEVAPRQELWVQTDNGPHVSDYHFLKWLGHWSFLAHEHPAQTIFDPTIFDDSPDGANARAQCRELIHCSNATTFWHASRPTHRAAAFAALSTLWP